MSIFKDYDWGQDDITKRSRAARGEPATAYKVSGSLLLVRSVLDNSPNGPGSGWVRGNVRGLSGSSLRRMRSYLREATSDYGSFITLTYGKTFPDSGVESKEHLRRFLQQLRRKYACGSGANDGREYSSFWFMEFQDRGAPHYHIYTTHFVPKSWLSLQWARIITGVRPGDPDQSEVVSLAKTSTNVKALKGPSWQRNAYAMKYANKSVQKECPENFKDCGRFWGVSGSRRRASADAVVRRSDLGKKSIKQAVEQLNDRIKMCISTSAIKIIVVRPGVRLFAIQNPVQKIQLSKMVDDLSELVFAVNEWSNELLQSKREEDGWQRKNLTLDGGSQGTFRPATLPGWRGMLSTIEDTPLSRYSHAQQKAWGLHTSGSEKTQLELL